MTGTTLFCIETTTTTSTTIVTVKEKLQTLLSRLLWSAAIALVGVCCFGANVFLRTHSTEQNTISGAEDESNRCTLRGVANTCLCVPVLCVPLLRGVGVY